MNSYLALGLFALYVAVVSLWRLMCGRGLPPLAEASEVWERRRQLLPHFLLQVATPLVVGVVFISRGIVGFNGGAAHHYDDVPQRQVYQQVATAVEMNRQARIAAAERWAAAEKMEAGALLWNDFNRIP